MSIPRTLPFFNLSIFNRQTSIYVFIGCINAPLNIARQKITYDFLPLSHLRM